MLSLVSYTLMPKVITASSIASTCGCSGNFFFYCFCFWEATCIWPELLIWCGYIYFFCPSSHGVQLFCFPWTILIGSEDSMEWFNFRLTPCFSLDAVAGVSANMIKFGSAGWGMKTGREGVGGAVLCLRSCCWGDLNNTVCLSFH